MATAVALVAVFGGLSGLVVAMVLRLETAMIALCYPMGGCATVALLIVGVTVARMRDDYHV